jgi:peptidoglycan/xylan/chitin deacetylase (PgdA/CDA1 family)
MLRQQGSKNNRQMESIDLAALPLRLMKRLWARRRDVVGAALHWSGIGRAFETVARPAGAIILMYHSISQDAEAEFVDPPNRLSPSLFKRQMAFLSAHRRVVPLSEVVRQVESGMSPPAGTVSITFDDGYLDNLTTAAPILEQYNLTATLFLATGYVERGESQWADTLYWLLMHRSSDVLSIPSIGLDETHLSLPAARAAARLLLHRQMLESGHDDRARLLKEVERQLCPVGKRPRLTLNWDEVRELRRRYPFFEIGGHTRDHIDLRTHRGPTARSQIEGCADDLQRELGAEPRHFSFPYSRWCAQTREAVSVSGWLSAVGMGDGIRIGAGSDRFAMPRVESPHTMSELRFKTSGAYPGVLSILGLE